MTLPADDGSTRPDLPDAVRVQILATEHWSLLATRQLYWTEAFSRVNIFLTVLSAAVVALALVAQTDRGHNFTVFAVVLLPVVLFLGLGTYFRLGSINKAESKVVIGMNRLRHAYFDIAPDLEPYFVTDSHDDLEGVERTIELGGPVRANFPVLQVIASTPVIVGIVDVVIAGVLCGIGARAAGLSTGAVFGIGALGALVLLGLLALMPVVAIYRYQKDYQPLFPG
ncbi:MAG: hypothetical protein WCB04_00370 [Mycobacteriales bacterium]